MQAIAKIKVVSGNSLSVQGEGRGLQGAEVSSAHSPL
jgi:hypothetical protein